MGKLSVLICPMDWGLGHASRCVPVIKAFRQAGCRVVVACSGYGADLIKKEFAVSESQCSGSEKSSLKDGVQGYAGSENISSYREDVPYEENGKDDSVNFAKSSHDAKDGGGLKIIPFPGFSVSYSGSFLFLKLMVQMPSFLYHIVREKRLLARLVEKIKPDLIVSDNRYGLVHKSTPSVLITHQLRPAIPFLWSIFEWPVSLLIRCLVKAFDQCWIPDCRDDPAAGRLINGWDRLPDAYFTGWLSRFSSGESSDTSNTSVTPGFSAIPGSSAIPGFSATSSNTSVTPGSSAPGNGSYRYRVMFILSGPEPQRSILEDLIIDGLGESDVRVLLVRGLPGDAMKKEKPGKIDMVAFLDSRDMLQAIMESELVVCRSGYSSVMDILMLGKRAVLIPTPGQPEQEYLGRWLSRKGWFRVINQKDFDPANLPDSFLNEITYNSDKTGDGKVEFLGDRKGYHHSSGRMKCLEKNHMLQERVETTVNRLKNCTS